MYGIKSNGMIKPVLITPKLLEEYIRQCKRNIANNHPSLKSNHNNNLSIIYKLADLYKVNYKVNKQIKKGIKTITVKIPAMNICEKGFGKTYNQAKRTLAYKVHRAYNQLIIH